MPVAKQCSVAKCRCVAVRNGKCRKHYTGCINCGAKERIERRLICAKCHASNMSKQNAKRYAETKHLIERKRQNKSQCIDCGMACTTGCLRCLRCSNRGDDPKPEQIAEIEQRMAALRAKKEARGDKPVCSGRVEFDIPVYSTMVGQRGAE